MITVSGLPATKFIENYKGTPDGEYQVVEMVKDGEIIEINGRTGKFDKILASFQFIESSVGMPGAVSNQWDVKEKRICVQMIAYARENKNSECEMFPTPCDVPDGWEVCGE